MERTLAVAMALGVLFIGTSFFVCANVSPSDLKVLFIGIDALDWEMVEPLREEGLLPHLQSLIQRGVSGVINTNDFGGSAVYWTSIATGQMSEKHGILDFVYVDPDTGDTTPYTSNMRQTKAFWNVLSDYDISVGVVGWFVSWPAEEVNGFMVSSYYTIDKSLAPILKGSIYENTPQMVYPESLQEHVDGLIQRAREKSDEKLLRVVKPSALESPTPHLEATTWAFLSDEIFNEIALDLYPSLAPKVFAVYFNGLDVVGHRFTREDPEWQARLEDRFGTVHRNYYLYMDEVIGQYLELVDDDTVVIVTADHGLMRGLHTNNGVFVMAGKNIRKNYRLPEPVNLTDIMPTLYYLLGLPLADDLDGQPLKRAFMPLFLVDHPVRRIPSYGEREFFAEEPSASQFDDVIIERLKSLGYLQ